jgi:hypothetical protein
MDFKELLKPDIKGRDAEVIESLRRSSHPVILYGAAVDVAGQIAAKLEKYGLRIAKIAVDGDCPAVTALAPVLSGTEICSVAEIEQHFPA